MTLEMEIDRRETAAMDKGMAQGGLKTLNALVQQKLITIADAAKQANMSVDAFTKAVAMLCKRHYWIKIPFCLFNLLTSCPQSRQL